MQRFSETAQNHDHRHSQTPMKYFCYFPQNFILLDAATHKFIDSLVQNLRVFNCIAHLLTGTVLLLNLEGEIVKKSGIYSPTPVFKYNQQNILIQIPKHIYHKIV